MNRGGWMIVADSKGRERERHQIVYGAKLKVKEGQEVELAQQLVEWDPFSFSILTEEAGRRAFPTDANPTVARYGRPAFSAS